MRSLGKISIEPHTSPVSGQACHPTRSPPPAVRKGGATFNHSPLVLTGGKHRRWRVFRPFMRTQQHSMLSRLAQTPGFLRSLTTLSGQLDCPFRHETPEAALGGIRQFGDGRL